MLFRCLPQLVKTNLNQENQFIFWPVEVHFNILYFLFEENDLVAYSSALVNKKHQLGTTDNSSYKEQQ